MLDDKLAAPFHAWPHRFRMIGRKWSDEVKLDAVQGHAPDTEGKKYGQFAPLVLHKEIVKVDPSRVEGECHPAAFKHAVCERGACASRWNAAT
jgi:hypothetical protein